VSYINNIVTKIIIYKLITKNDRVIYYIYVVSSIQSILILFILNYWKSCKSNCIDRNIFIYKYTSLIIINRKYILAIKKTKKNLKKNYIFSYNKQQIIVIFILLRRKIKSK